MYRLIYKSRSAAKIDWEVVGSILHSAEKNNQSMDITGVLLASESHFLQVLEGRYEDINKLFFHIAKDPRHTDLQLVAFNVVDARLFSGWGMRGLDVMNFNRSLSEMLKEKYGEEGNAVKFPVEEWLALALINDIQMIHGLPEWKK